MKALRWFTFTLILVLFLLPASATLAQGAGPSSAGDLDPEFGEGGKLLIPLDVSNLHSVRLVVQPDGKLLVAATVSDTAESPSTIIVLRLLPDGSPDPSFDGDGGIEIGFPEENLSLGALLLQPDGNILVVGSAAGGILMARYLPDGSPDTSFGEGGRVHATYPGGPITGTAAGLLPDGRILVSGTVFNNEIINGFDAGVYVARFSPDGSLDLGFGQNGFGLDLFESSESELVTGVDDLVVLPDGKIVVVGQGGDDVGNWIIRRFHPDGSFDAGTRFPDNDACSGCFDEAFAAVLQPDGGLLVGGVRSKIIEEDGNIISVTNAFAMLRFNPDHSPDESFGEGGEVFTSFPSSNNDVAYDMTLQQDGKIILAGESQQSTSDFALARYHPDGSLDESFGEAGLVTTDFGGFDSANAVAIQPDGKIVAAGRSSVGGGQWSLALARYLSDSTEGPMQVPIDIRPGSRQNIILLGRMRVIPVAILSTQEFDARQIDKSSLTFGRTGEEQSLIACLRGLDINHDRLPDSLCFFLTRLTGFQVGDTEGILQGRMQDGTAIEGHDQVTIRRWRGK